MATLPSLQLIVITSLMIIFNLEFSQAKKRLSIAEQSTFYGAQNRGLQNAKYMVRKAASFVTCIRDCQVDPGCYSVVYRRCSHICELNEATRIQHPKDFKEMQGNVYFDINKDTLLSSLPDDVTCNKLLKAGAYVSGIYTLSVGQRQVQAYCDMTTDGGGWMVFQRRQDGSLDFYRNWVEYQEGFGNPAGEFWLGNDVIRNLTEFSCPWKLHIDLEDWEGSTAWAEYDNFRLEGDLYTLHIGAYIGTAGDSLTYNSGWAFSTKDRDSDNAPLNCAEGYRGAWWYNYCHIANLNGEYHNSRKAGQYSGITWRDWQGDDVSLKKCSMKIRESMYL